MVIQPGIVHVPVRKNISMGGKNHDHFFDLNLDIIKENTKSFFDITKLKHSKAKMNIPWVYDHRKCNFCCHSNATHTKLNC